MAFPTNPSSGDSYTDEYGTVWVYAGTVNGWYRQTVLPSNEVTYTGGDGGGGGVSDGNKGDITVSSGGTVWNVNDGAVALNELNDVTLTSPSDGQSLRYNAATGQWVNSTPAGGGTVTSVGIVTPTGFSVSGSPVTTSGNITLSFAAGYSLPTTASQANWDTAYSERLYWDGGATGLNAATGRTSLGLGNSATLNVGTTAGTVAAGDALGAHEAAADPHPSYALESSLGGAALLNVGTTAGTVAAGDDNRFVPSGGTVGQVLSKVSGTDYDASWQTLTVSDVFIIACSDETSNLTAGTDKSKFTMPYAGTLTAVKADVNTAPTGSTLVVDINEAGVSVLSTKLSIDAGETSSSTAATPAVISDSALADGAVISIDIDQIGSTVAGAGLKVTLYITRS